MAEPNPEIPHLERLGLTEFRLADVAGLVAESEGAFMPSVKNPDEKTSELLAKFEADDPNFGLFGYEVDGRPASYIVALSHQGEGTIAIGPMFVASAFRGRGLGKKQVVDFVNRYRGQGCHTIFTKTWSSNQASRATFENLGFTIAGVKEHDRANGDDSIMYQLDL